MVGRVGGVKLEGNRSLGRWEESPPPLERRHVVGRPEGATKGNGLKIMAVKGGLIHVGGRTNSDFTPHFPFKVRVHVDLIQLLPFSLPRVSNHFCCLESVKSANKYA